MGARSKELACTQTDPGPAASARRGYSTVSRTSPREARPSPTCLCTAVDHAFGDLDQGRFDAVQVDPVKLPDGDPDQALGLPVDALQGFALGDQVDDPAEVLVGQRTGQQPLDLGPQGGVL